ncbi:MAG: MOSC domain-containing protein [Flavobacteriaceae bacterium]|nr:MOSC domain-containing protein [Flavobacteriaceae bacterium]
MKVIATNIAKPRDISWKGRIQSTGIYKFPTAGPINLKNDAVKGDSIGNKNVHGGKYMACYLYSSEHYAYWKELYPQLDWDWGMFGENLTTEGLLDTDIFIGDIFKIGTAVVQATIPREPCYKLGIKFNDQRIIKQFIDHGFPGAYVRILKEGEIESGDKIIKTEAAQKSVSIYDFFRFINSKELDRRSLEQLIDNPYLPEYKKTRFARLLQ